MDNLMSCLTPQGPPTDAPAVDTAEQVYISSLALLKVNIRMSLVWIRTCLNPHVSFCSPSDVEARPGWRTDGSHGADARGVCWWLHSAGDRRVRHASVRNGLYQRHCLIWKRKYRSYSELNFKCSLFIHDILQPGVEISFLYVFVLTGS